MTADKPFYITTAISYPNGAPHIGHAYELIATDAIARFMRLLGRDVYFLTGTDEHGIKMHQTAQKEGISAQDLADRNAKRFQDMTAALNASQDDFIRTTQPRHYKAAQAIWQKMQERGDIYLSTYAGWYSVRDEAFYAESEITLNSDGVRLSPQGTPVEWIEEKSYFFKLSAYQDKLLQLYEDQPEFIGPDGRRNEIMQFVKGGLQDLSISRTTFDWGIPVPDAADHVMYVWVDALTNYLTGVGYPDSNHKLWPYWEEGDITHIIGKDIARFHTVYWPAFLMSAGVKLPSRVYCHGFLFNKGEKMSKSVGNVVDPFALADVYGVDALRYFLLREVPFGQDGNYSHDAIVQRLNADLANDLGNLAQRSLSMVAKHCEGRVPKAGSYSNDDIALLKLADGLLSQMQDDVDSLKLQNALANLWSVVAETNKYFANQAPWTLRKTDADRFATVLYVTMECLRQIGILFQPFCPQSAQNLLDLLNVPSGQRDFKHCGETARLQSGADVPAPFGLFPRYVEEEGAS